MSDLATWAVGQGRALGPAAFFVVGILNVTPDSFYDGGRHFKPDHAVRWGRRLAAQGADVVDVGGESTRPFAEPVGPEEERDRVVPVIEALARPGEPGPDGRPVPPPVLSVDTYKAVVAAGALGAGALIVNDVSACRFDPGLLDVLAQFRPGYVLMHAKGMPREMQKAPAYDDVLAEIEAFFEERLAALTRAGLPEANVVLDPGIGFGKRLEHNLTILRHIERFKRLGRPLCVGLSNKSLWGDLLGLSREDRQNATQVATALLARRGVAVHRVHEVDQTRQTLTVVREIG
jgi:dihydropteroate synthase